MITGQINLKYNVCSKLISRFKKKLLLSSKPTLKDWRMKLRLNLPKIENKKKGQVFCFFMQHFHKNIKKDILIIKTIETDFLSIEKKMVRKEKKES